MRGHVEDLLSAYMDGELSLPERGMVEAHLAACDACARHLDQLAAVDAALRELPAEAPADYFESFPARLRTRLRQPAPPQRVRRLPTWAWAAAAAAVVAVIAPLTLRETHFEHAGAPSEHAPLAASAGAPKPQDDRHAAREGWPSRKVAPGDVSRPATPDVRKAPSSTDSTLALDSAPPASAPVLAQSAQADTRGPADIGEQAAAQWAEPPPAAPGRQQPGEFQERRAHEVSPPGGVATSPRSESARELAGRDMRVAPEPNQAMQGTLTGGGAPTEGLAERERLKAAQADTEEQDPAMSGPTAATEATAASPKAAARGRPTSSPAAPSRTRAGLGADEEFESLRARHVSDLESARELRDLWRAFAARNPSGPRGDLARLQVIEIGYRALRLGRDARDREVLVRDAHTYLEREDGQHAARVRNLLADAERP